MFNFTLLCIYTLNKKRIILFKIFILSFFNKKKLELFLINYKLQCLKGVKTAELVPGEKSISSGYFTL